MYEIYLIRHAIAEERGQEWPDDNLRPLTREGIDRFRAVVGGMAGLRVEIDDILTSPLIRARQTAELLAGGLGRRPQITVCEVLSPGHGPRSVAAALRKSSGHNRMAVVGHEPDLGHLAAFLLGTAKPIPFKKGGVCRVDIAGRAWAGRGTLVWLAPPRILSRLRRG